MGNRILKESICTSEDIDALGWFGEVLYYRLIVNCDDYGRMDARTAILKARLFPLREVAAEAIEEALDVLEALGCVRRYEAGGRPYLLLRAWEKHQRVRVSRAKYPAPEEEVGAEADMEAGEDAKVVPLVWGAGEGDAVDGGGSPQVAARGGESPPEPESEEESESISEAESEGETEDAVAAAVVAVGMPYMPKDAEIARGLRTAYGEAWVVAAIERAADGPSRTWRYVRGILRRWRDQGGMDAGGAGGAAGAERVPARMYTQRAYSREELSGLVERL